MAQSSAPRDQGIGASLAVESAAWRSLLDLLEEEERALIDGEAARLAQLNASKLAQLDKIGDLARARQTALASMGLTSDHGGMARWLTQHGQSEHHLCWRQLCELEQQSRAINQRIGILIGLRLAATRQALNVLVQSASGPSGLYDQAGQAVGDGKGNCIVAI